MKNHSASAMMDSMSVQISVVIPSYNEMTNIRRGVLDDVAAYLFRQKYTWEVILSDDGSTDSTLPALEVFAQHHPGFTVLPNAHAGKAAVVTAGMMKAKGAWRLFTDFDQSTPLVELEKLLLAVQDSVDIVIGSREVEGAVRDKEPWYRHFMGKCFNLVVQTLTVKGIQDTQCGFKLFSAAAAEKLFPKLQVYSHLHARTDAFTGAFDVELLYLAHKEGYQVKEVPIIWKHRPTSRVSPVKDSLRMFRDVVHIRLTDLLGGYG